MAEHRQPGTDTSQSHSLRAGGCRRRLPRGRREAPGRQSPPLLLLPALPGLAHAAAHPATHPAAHPAQKGPIMTSQAGNYVISLGRGQRAHCHANTRLERGGGPSASGFCATPRIPLPTFRRLWAAPASDLAPAGLPETPRGKALLEPGFESRLLLHSPSHRPLGQG